MVSRQKAHLLTPRLKNTDTHQLTNKTLKYGNVKSKTTSLISQIQAHFRQRPPQLPAEAVSGGWGGGGQDTLKVIDPQTKLWVLQKTLNFSLGSHLLLLLYISKISSTSCFSSFYRMSWYKQWLQKTIKVRRKSLTNGHPQSPEVEIHTSERPVDTRARESALPSYSRAPSFSRTPHTGENSLRGLPCLSQPWEKTKTKKKEFQVQVSCSPGSQKQRP